MFRAVFFTEGIYFTGKKKKKGPSDECQSSFFFGTDQSDSMIIREKKKKKKLLLGDVVWISGHSRQYAPFLLTNGFNCDVCYMSPLSYNQW